MTAPGKKFFGAGLASVRIYTCNAAGLPAGNSATVPYDGTLIGGPISVNLDGLIPDPTVISHPGNDTVLQFASFPGVDPASGTLTVSRRDMDTLATLAANSVFTEGEINSIGWGTSKSGQEIDVWLVIYQSGYVAGIEVYGTYVLKCKMYAKPRSMTTRDRSDITYNLTPIVVSSEITGRALNSSDDGATTNTMREYESNNRLHFAFFLGDGAHSSFPLNTALPAADTAAMVVYNNNTIVSAGGYTAKSTTYVHLLAVVPTGSLVAIKYGIAITAVDVD